MMSATRRNIIATLSIILTSPTMLAQRSSFALPNEPKVQWLEVAFSQASAGGTVAAQAPSQGAPLQLSRQDAEKIALANNPHIHISQLLARVQHQVIRERRADELPNLNGALTAVEANDGSRISSGSLTASRLLIHAGMGVQLSQLITDFGRTSNLIASAKLQEKARLADAEASREDIVLATDQAFYAVVEAQATLAVAIQTVSARQALTDQVSALTSAKLKSDLDQSFAQVNLSQAKLLQLNAQNDLDAARAAFTAVLGYERPIDFVLIDDAGPLPTMPPDFDTLVAQAIQNRPDLQSLRFSEQAALKFSKAQHEQLLPTFSALGTVGGTPVGSPQYFTSNWYGAVGGNISVPIFGGFRLTAQASEATLQAESASEATWALGEQVVRVAQREYSFAAGDSRLRTAQASGYCFGTC